MNQQFFCPICSSEKSNEYFSVQDYNQEKSDEKFEYYKCIECESIYLRTIPSNLGCYYGDEYPAYKPNENNKNNLRLSHENQKINIVKEYVKEGFLVEVGPAAGSFLDEANSAGFDVLGLEQDENSVNHIRKDLSLNCELTNNPAEKLYDYKGECDVVVAWHVIEHLVNLDVFVKNASLALKDEKSVLIVSAPNPRALSFKIFKKYWVHLDAPRHVTLIDKYALDELMGKYGLERIEKNVYGQIEYDLNMMGWIMSFKNCFKENKFIFKLWSKLVRSLNFLFKILDNQKDRGASYTLIYKKRK